MSHCRYDDRNSCDRDYWFDTENESRTRFRNCCRRPNFPTVLQANVIIPQTVIPVRIVVSPLGTLTQDLGFGTNLQSISTTQQTVGLSGSIPFSTNIPGNGFIQRILRIYFL
ncbi:MAG: hypothetical protein K0R72_787 [Clostridia bacterium]|nr:hypothetical protein [Clostridia bacterium]